MKFSKRCEYGIRASVRLASTHGSGYLQSREIASSEHLPAKFLESILLALRSGGILESKVGAGGGYRLTRPPQEIRVHDLLEALNGNESEDRENADASEIGIGQHGLDIVLERMNSAIEDRVGGLSLADLLSAAEERTAATAPAMYHI